MNHQSAEVNQVESILNVYAAGIGKVYRFLILHLLWLVFTLLGCIIFGLFPACHALLETMKKSTDLGTKAYFYVFLKSYKTAFLKINQAAIIWFTMFGLMSMNLFIFRDGRIYVQLGIMGMLLLMVLCLIYFFQHFTLYETIIKQIRRSFGYVFMYPKKNIIYMCVIFGCILALQFSPGVTVFFFSSVVAHFIVNS